jgi:hypothetical protein
MAAALIKIVKGDQIWEFQPAGVSKISANIKSSEIQIALTNGDTVHYTLPSPADAQARLSSLEAAIVSGTGLVTLTDAPLSFTTTTTSTTTTPTTTTTSTTTSGGSPGPSPAPSPSPAG